MRLSDIREIVRHILIQEGRLDRVLNTVDPEHHDDIKRMAEADPTGKLKYLSWQVKQLVRRREPVDEIIDLTQHFEKVRNRLTKKDIFAYRTLGDLRQAIEKTGESKTQKKAKVKEGADLVYEDDRFVVISPQTVEASQLYGRGTRWCVSATTSKNYFNSYSEQNLRFYFVIDRSGEDQGSLSKVAILYTGSGTLRDDIYNAQDSRISLGTLRSHLGESFNGIMAATKEHARKHGDTEQFKKLPEKRKRRQWINQIDNTDNPNEIDRAFEHLRQGEEDWELVQRALSRNPNVSSEGIEELLAGHLAGDHGRIVVRNIAKNPATPEDALYSLYGDPDFQNDVKANPNIPLDLARQVVRDEFRNFSRSDAMFPNENCLSRLPDGEKFPYQKRLLLRDKDSVHTLRRVLRTVATIENLRQVAKIVLDTATTNLNSMKYYINESPVAHEFRRQRALAGQPGR